MFRDSIIAAIRTGVAFGVTWLIAKALGLGVQIDTDTQAALSVVLFGLAVAAYNFVVGVLERRVNPYFGILLGVPKAPAYGAVGTQTPPPNAPVVGHPRTDRGAVDTSILGAITLIVAGILVILFTTVALLGWALVTAGLILVLVFTVNGNRPPRTGRRS